jgi:uncharacterized protein (TIGR02466 family)
MQEINRNIFQAFPVNFFKEENFLSLEHCDFLKNFFSEQKADHHPLFDGEAKSSHRFNSEIGILDMIPEPLKDLKQQIQKRIDYFTNTCDLPPCKISNSWFNIQDEGSLANFHAHPFSALSGVLYVFTDDESSKLEFLNPNYSIFQYNGKDGFLLNDVKIGTLIIFPSYIVHGSRKQNKTMGRTILSFNTFITK